MCDAFSPQVKQSQYPPTLQIGKCGLSKFLSRETPRGAIGGSLPLHPRPTQSLGRHAAEKAFSLTLTTTTAAMLRSSIAKSLVNASPRASRLAARPVIARAYHEKVISHYEQPRNVCLVRSGLLCPFIR